MQSASNVDLRAVEADYASGLLELQDSNKLIIDSMTVIAQENVAAASVIVSAIEERIRTAPMEEKLPALYLMDSICKFAKPDNVRQVYIASFTRNVVKVFGNAYNMVSDEIQKRLERLMDTWRVQRVFPTHIIRSLESVIGQPSSGPAYPSYPGSQQQQAFNPNSAPQLPLLAPSSAPNLAMLAQQVQAVLTYKRQMQMVNPNDAQTNAHINGLEALLAMIASGQLLQASQADQVRTVNQIQAIYAATFPPVPQQLAVPSATLPPMDPGRNSPRTPGSVFEDSSSALNARPGMPIRGGTPELGRSTIARVGRISLTTEDINRKRPGAFQAIYEAYPQQCRQCGLRFAAGEEGSKKMGVHMDFHFRQNRRVMDKGKKMMSRDWYVSVDDWVANREAKISEEHTPFFGVDALKPEVGKKKAGAAAEEVIPNVKAPEGDSASLLCPICHEKFQKFWDEDAEEWMLKNAIMFEGKVRHYTCHKEVMGKKRSGSRSPDPGLVVRRGGSPGPSLLGKRGADDSDSDLPESKRSNMA